LALTAPRAGRDAGLYARSRLPIFIPTCRAPAGTFFPQGDFAFGLPRERQLRERNMHGLIYLIGLIVVILFILSLLGLR
jgi:hypothetical protein